MDWLDSLVLGVLQGLAEYLPISSSGHLVIGTELLDKSSDGADNMMFTVALHLATVLSTIVILWKEFVPLCSSFFRFRNDANTSYVFKILLSCVPIMIVGFTLKDKVAEMFTNLTVVGICLVATAALLTFAFITRKETNTAAMRQGGYQPRNITYLDAFVMGIAQAIAVLPGLSRSGSTIATGIMLGDKREQVAKFSFFMVIIPIVGESMLTIIKLLTGSAEETAAAESIGIVPLVIGFLSAFIVGCLACKWMLNLVKNGKLIWFAIYCLIVGLVCIFF